MQTPTHLLVGALIQKSFNRMQHRRLALGLTVSHLPNYRRNPWAILPEIVLLVALAISLRLATRRSQCRPLPGAPT